MYKLKDVYRTETN